MVVVAGWSTKDKLSNWGRLAEMSSSDTRSHYFQIPVFGSLDNQFFKLFCLRVEWAEPVSLQTALRHNVLVIDDQCLSIMLIEQVPASRVIWSCIKLISSLQPPTKPLTMSLKALKLFSWRKELHWKFMSKKVPVSKNIGLNLPLLKSVVCQSGTIFYINHAFCYQLCRTSLLGLPIYKTLITIIEQMNRVSLASLKGFL